MKFFAFCLCLLFYTLFTFNLDAHTRSQSFSHWETNDTSVNFTFAVDARRVTQLTPLYNSTDDLDILLTQHLQETIVVKQNNIACELTRLNSTNQNQSTMRAHGQYQCPQFLNDANVMAIVTSFQAVSPTHIHIARIEHSGIIAEQVIREGRASFNLLIEKPDNDFSGFTATGFWHVLSGIDHLVFLLALLLVASNTRSIIICVTGFTLGHSLALAFATLGWLTPKGNLIEALIGFTIAITALEAGIKFGLDRRKALYAFALLCFLIILPIAFIHKIPIIMGAALVIYTLSNGKFSEKQAQQWLPIVTIAFGLIHGAGFAGGLKEATLFQAEILMPLLGFNIGVELAQLAALAILLSLAWLIKKIALINFNAVQHAAALCAFGLGCFWFAERIWI